MPATQNKTLYRTETMESTRCREINVQKKKCLNSWRTTAEADGNADATVHSTVMFGPFFGGLIVTSVKRKIVSGHNGGFGMLTSSL